MKKVCIIGTGNVAWHLCVALAGKVEELTCVSAHDTDDIPRDAQCYILAVSDSAIEQVAKTVKAAIGIHKSEPEDNSEIEDPELKPIVAHVAGSVGMDVLKADFSNCGVLYPMQTFTKGIPVDYESIPVFVECSNTYVENRLKELAALFTPIVHNADSNQRMRLHLACVVACNYANHLWAIAEDILNESGFSLSVLFPLIDATVAKIKRISPREAQTGPAVRGDTGVLNKHMELLSDTAKGDIYRIIAQSIIESKNERD